MRMAENHLFDRMNRSLRDLRISVILFLGHAVRAPEVAPVGDGDPQVAHDTAEGVDEVTGPLLGHRIRIRVSPAS